MSEQARWNIPLERLAGKGIGQLEKLARVITFKTFRRVVLRSPVDKGRFIANWNVSYQNPDYSSSDTTNQSRGTEQAAKALELPIGGVVWLSNGLPYARRLEHGWSGKAPQGMVGITVAEFGQLVRQGNAP